VWIDEFQFRILITALVPDEVSILVWQYRQELYATEVYKHATETWLYTYYASTTVPQTSKTAEQYGFVCAAVDRN